MIGFWSAFQLVFFKKKRVILRNQQHSRVLNIARFFLKKNSLKHFAKVCVLCRATEAGRDSLSYSRAFDHGTISEMKTL